MGGPGGIHQGVLSFAMAALACIVVHIAPVNHQLLSCKSVNPEFTRLEYSAVMSSFTFAFEANCIEYGVTHVEPIFKKRYITL